MILLKRFVANPRPRRKRSSDMFNAYECRLDIVQARRARAAGVMWFCVVKICNLGVSACNKGMLATCEGNLLLSDRFISSDGVAYVDASHTFSGSSYRLIWSDVSHLLACVGNVIKYRTYQF